MEYDAVNAGINRQLTTGGTG